MCKFKFEQTFQLRLQKPYNIVIWNTIYPAVNVYFTVLVLLFLLTPCEKICMLYIVIIFVLYIT